MEKYERKEFLNGDQLNPTNEKTYNFFINPKSLDKINDNIILFNSKKYSLCDKNIKSLKLSIISKDKTHPINIIDTNAYFHMLVDNHIYYDNIFTNGCELIPEGGMILNSLLKFQDIYFSIHNISNLHDVINDVIINIEAKYVDLRNLDQSIMFDVLKNKNLKNVLKYLNGKCFMVFNEFIPIENKNYYSGYYNYYLNTPKENIEIIGMYCNGIITENYDSINLEQNNISYCMIRQYVEDKNLEYDYYMLENNILHHYRLYSVVSDGFINDLSFNINNEKFKTYFYFCGKNIDINKNATYYFPTKNILYIKLDYISDDINDDIFNNLSIRYNIIKKTNIKILNNHKTEYDNSPNNDYLTISDIGFRQYILDKDI